MKKRIYFPLIVSICALTILGVILFVNNQQAGEKFDESLTVNSEQALDEKSFSVEGLNMYPGASKSVNVLLSLQEKDEYVFTIEFIEKNDGGLKDFIDADVEIDGQVKLQASLKDLLGGQKFEYNLATTQADQKIIVKVIYKMDVSVTGGEGATATFDMILSIKRA